MSGIKWIQHGTNKFPHYCAKIGGIELWCREGIVNGWCGSVYLGVTWLADSRNIRKSSELAKKDAERLAVKYMLGNGFVVLKALKKMNLLEDMLFEVGVDL